MFKLTKNEENILFLFVKNELLSSSQVHKLISNSGVEISLVTVKRHLSALLKASFLETSGAGRSTVYSLSVFGRLFLPVNIDEYCGIEPDIRPAMKNYNFKLWSDFPTRILTSDEETILHEATQQYRERSLNLSSTLKKKELERLIIELSWKSSKIEGNTYTLLDTEKLILENQSAVGKSREEAVMILNHKAAFDFVRNNARDFRTLNYNNLERLHAILIKDLNVNVGLRSKPVGITGSVYRPLDNKYQIQEAVLELSKVVDKLDSPYDKALLALVGLSYIQPFEDGNKRTSRLMANAILLAYDLAPLSYRSVDEKNYRQAMLVFYELNSIVSIKDIFIEQYLFAAENYALADI